LKKLTGRKNIEDALTRLEKMSNDEALMATTQVLEAADTMGGKMEQVVDGAQHASIFKLLSWLIVAFYSDATD
jgi:hypothetical protein